MEASWWAFDITWYNNEMGKEYALKVMKDSMR